jgi:hypothetical protein
VREHAVWKVGRHVEEWQYIMRPEFRGLHARVWKKANVTWSEAVYGTAIRTRKLMSDY